jgi:predicted PurR-regulated permease PerM
MTAERGAFVMIETGGGRRGGLGNVALVEKFVILLLFSLLLVGVYLVLKPFLLGLVLGCILAIAAWPVRSRLVMRGLPPAVAAALMLVVLLLFVLIPVMLVSPGLEGDMKALEEKFRSWFAASPQLPSWLAGLPLIGDRLDDAWQSVTGHSPESDALLAKYAQQVRQFLIAAAVDLASSIVHLVIALITAAALWAQGDRTVDMLRAILLRLGGSQLASLTAVAAGAVRGVFYGIVGTAAIQGLLMSLGLMLVGIPAAATLGFVTVILAISQFGGVLINLVWAGAAWYLYTESGMGLAVWFVVIWGLFVTYMETFIKPLLIGARMRLPMMLVILGVFGGFISFGFLGLFIGPTLLAVAYEILVAWRGLGPPERSVTSDAT